MEKDSNNNLTNSELEISSAILRSAYQGLTKSEKRIADFIMEHAGELMKLTISDIAAATDSSEITVSRFCKKLGYSGLQSFKIAFITEQNTVDETVFREISPNDTNEQVSRKVFQSISDGLEDTLKVLSSDAIEKAVNAILNTSRIAVYGFGNSAMVCFDIETRFLRFGIPVQAYADAHQQVTSASLLGQGDVVIAVSHSGATIELLESVEVARSNGAIIIAITSHAQSPLSRLADIVLLGMGREVNYRSEAVSSRLVHIAITDILYTCISMRIPDYYKKNLNKMRKAIAKKRV